MGRSGTRNRRVPPISGSVTGSIAEEDENQTSGSEDEGNLVVHENQRGGAGRVPPPAQSHATMTNGGGSKRFSSGTGVGVPSITDFRNVQRRDSGSSGGSSAAGRAGGRKTQSEVGIGYNPPRNRHKTLNRASLRRTFSGGAASDGSSVRSLRGSGKKKGGFFKSLAKLFKTKPAGESTAGSRRGGADSPPLTSRSAGGWTTRTDTNLRHRSGISAAAADSSDDEDTMGRGPMVAVTNNRNNTWSVDKVGLAGNTAKTGKTTKKSRSDLGAGKGRSNSQSTITPASPSAKVVSKPPGVARSNTMNSVSTAGAVEKGSKRLRQGSITRTRAGGSNVGAPSIGSVLDQSKAPAPKLMEVPKAPKSQVTPQMFTVTAPPPSSQSLLQSPPALSTSASAPLGFGESGNKRASTMTMKSTKSTASSNATTMPRSATTNLDNLGLGAPVGGTSVGQNREARESTDSLPPRGQTPLPPSKTLSPPAKSAMRASSPVPHFQALPPPAPPAFMVKAPGPVVLDKPVEPEVKTVPAPVKEEEPVTRYVTPATIVSDAATMTDGESIYESAVEDEGDVHESDDEANGYAQPIRRGPPSEAGTEDSDDTAILSRYKVVENTEGLAGKIKGESKVPIEDFHTYEETKPEPVAASQPAAGSTLQVPGQSAARDDFVPAAPVSMTESTIERRKSVRMNIPDSPSSPTTTTRRDPSDANGWSTSRVGRVMESSDEDESAAYVKARKGLAKYASLGSGNGNGSPGKTPKKKKSASKMKSKA